MMKIDIIIPCGITDIKNEIEIDRFKRFKLQLQNIKEIPNKPDNINWTFCEFGTDSRLEKTIKNYLPNANYCFYNSSDKFNQITCWYVSKNFLSNSDFLIFSHCDILFSKNLYDVLNRRINNKNCNYYSFRMNSFVNDLSILDNELISYEINCSDMGMEYVQKSNGEQYTEKFNVKSYLPIHIDSMLNQNPNSDYFIKENNQISESFICISRETFEKLDLSPEASYHNDVVVRDLSIICGLSHEWIHDEICLIHMLGKDLYKASSDDFDTTLKILEHYPELAHFGLFRFHPNYIPYILKSRLNVQNIYDNYITKDIYRNQTFEKELKQLC